MGRNKLRVDAKVQAEVIRSGWIPNTIGRIIGARAIPFSTWTDVVNYTFVEDVAYDFRHMCKAPCFQYIIRLYLIMKNTKLIRESYNVYLIHIYHHYGGPWMLSRDVRQDWLAKSGLAAATSQLLRSIARCLPPSFRFTFRCAL